MHPGQALPESTSPRPSAALPHPAFDFHATKCRRAEPLDREVPLWSAAAALPIHARRRSARPWRRSSDSAPTGLARQACVRPAALAAIGSVSIRARPPELLRAARDSARIQAMSFGCIPENLYTPEKQRLHETDSLPFSSDLAIERPSPTTADCVRDANRIARGYFPPGNNFLPTLSFSKTPGSPPPSFQIAAARARAYAARAGLPAPTSRTSLLIPGLPEFAPYFRMCARSSAAPASYLAPASSPSCRTPVYPPRRPARG